MKREKHMKNYKLPRRVWRALYPTLIHLAFLAWFLPLLYKILEHFALAATLYAFGTHLGLLPSILGIAVFLHMWLKTRDETPVYVNRKFLRVVALTIGLCAGFVVFDTTLVGLAGLARLLPASAAVIVPRASALPWVRMLEGIILAPIAEELCYRGVTLNRLTWLPKWAAVLICAMLFALVHRELHSVISALPFGILLSVLYMKFRSIIAVIAGHITYNLFVSILNYIRVDASVPRYIAFFAPMALIVISALCVYALVKFPAAWVTVATESNDN
jgi:membrane protease YdiL (CAAX protease family)